MPHELRSYFSVYRISNTSFNKEASNNAIGGVAQIRLTSIEKKIPKIDQQKRKGPQEEAPNANNCGTSKQEEKISRQKNSLVCLVCQGLHQSR